MGSAKKLKKTRFFRKICLDQFSAGVTVNIRKIRKKMSFSFLRNLISLWANFGPLLPKNLSRKKSSGLYLLYNFIHNNQKNSQIPKKFHAFFEKFEKPHFVPFCPEKHQNDIFFK